MYKPFWAEKWVGREGQRRSKYGPEWAFRYKPHAKLLASQPSRGPKMGQGSLKIDPKWSSQLPMISLSQFQGCSTHLEGLWTDSKPTVLLWVFSARCILGHILTLPTPLPTRSNFYGPAYSTTCLMFNSHLWRYFRPCEDIFTAFFAVSSDFLIRQFFKIDFLKIPQRPNFVIEILNPIRPSTFWTF